MSTILHIVNAKHLFHLKKIFIKKDTKNQEYRY